MVFPSDSYNKSEVKRLYHGRCKIIKFKNDATKDLKTMKKKGFSRKDFERLTSDKVYKIKYDGEYIHGRFRAIGCLVILWCYFQKAYSISVVGMDGYSLYSKDEYNKGEQKQHFYGKDDGSGYTDSRVNHSKWDIDNKNKFYNFCSLKDKDIYNSLKDVYKFGARFEILTPTVYNKFYNSNVLDKKS